MNRRLCVIQAGGGGEGRGGNEQKFHIYEIFTWKKAYSRNRGKKYTQDKQTNTQKMKHAPTEP